LREPISVARIPDRDRNSICSNTNSDNNSIAGKSRELIVDVS
jgi:hypothetical protein